MSQAPKFKANPIQKILPPFWFFGGLAAMAVLHYVYPTPLGFPSQFRMFGWVVLAAAFVMAGLAKRRFDVAGTPVRPFTESTSIVDQGLFRYSRNPMYLAMGIGLAGFALVTGDGLSVVIVPGFYRLIESQFIVHEERILAEKFGQAYLDYKSRVGRWI